MSQTKELSSYLDEIRKVGTRLVEIAECLTVKEDAKEEKEIEFTDIRAKLAEKSRKGHTEEIKALLKKYGAERLSDIKPNCYEKLMSDVEEL